VTILTELRQAQVTQVDLLVSKQAAVLATTAKKTQAKEQFKSPFFFFFILSLLILSLLEWVFCNKTKIQNLLII
jgi:hypothetical protein